MMNIWLDDERKPPYNFVWVKTPEACIEILKLMEVNILSLDHDLGLINPDTLEEKTGYDVLLWLENNTKYMPKEVVIHTANSVAMRRMKMALESIERRINA